jgi:hypothetical protein
MLLLRAEGLHSVLQMAWSVYRKTVAEVLSPPGELIPYGPGAPRRDGHVRRQFSCSPPGG